MRKSMIIIFLVVLVMTLSVVRTVLFNKLSTAGIAMSEIEEDIHLYKLENAMLSEKLFLESSLNSIASKAAALGYVEEKSQLVLSKSLPLAVRQ